MLSTQGYEIVPGIISDARCAELIDLLSRDSSQAGDRNALSVPTIQQLARQLKTHPLLIDLMPLDAVAVQCTLFDKSPSTNWLVAIHQDLSIAVAERVEDPRCTGWSTKEGVHYVQPPIEVLQWLVAVRVHLDECVNDNGPLRLVAGSHLRGRWTQAEVDQQRAGLIETECPISRGGALIMSPLLLHASSKAKAPAHRRVLHFLFGPRDLPCGLRWHQVV